MIEQLLTEHLDTWTQAVETKSAAGRGSSKKLNLVGIKKLRELILELAVRGQLVPQDENDEPAEVLLARIAAERERLVKEKKIKKPKKLPEISEDEKLFDLPDGWAWARFPEISDYKPGKTPSTKNTSYWSDDGSGVPWVSIADLNDRSEVVQTNKKITSEAKTDVFKCDPVKAGTLLMSFKLTVGKISLLGIDAFHNEAIISILPSTGISLRYLMHFLPALAQAGKTKKAIMGNTLNASSLSLLLIPIPPQIEQNRIVSKVDELMALCDVLEQEQESSIAAHGLLVENLLVTLTNAENQGEFKQAWVRVAAYFDTLFTTEQSVEQLKQTILQLAVMGKLVEQDPADEPAGVLLERIAAEKKRLVDEKVIKKQKALPEISEEEKVFELPVGWAWCRFADLANEVATGPFGSMIHKRDYIESGVPLINPSHMINSVIVEDKSISVSKQKASELDSYELFTGDIVMARRGEMGRCALVSERENGWLCGTGSFVLRFQAELSREYILLFFKTNWTKSYLGGKSIGTTMTNLNHGILNKMPVLLPPLEEQKRIVARVAELLVFCERLKSNIETAQSIQLSLSDALTDLAVG